MASTGTALSRYKELADLIDKERIAKSLDYLAKISDSSFGPDGVTRLAYSDLDIKGKTYITQLMSEAGLEVRVSPMGNIFGRLQGAQSDDKPVLSGSHTDSVINGGHFDGVVGVVCAIEALRVLQQVKDELIHPLEAIDFAMEESSRFGVGLFGSRVFTGEKISESTLLLQDSQGVSLGQAIEKMQSLPFSEVNGKSAGGSDVQKAMNAVEQSRGQMDKVHAYVEFHVEQAGFLEEAGIPIGIVSGAAMPTRWAIEITGEQAHSGATPMEHRKNALVAASECVLLVDQLCKEESAQGTVGAITKMTVAPNAMNTVPGKCTMFLDLRSTDKQSKDKVKAKLLKEITEICERHKVTFTHNVISEDDPKTFSANIMEISKKICEALKIPNMTLPSRAGHDACNMSNRIKEVGMIFVPSKGGVSHHHAEWTDIDDIILGTKILLLTLLELATEKNSSK